LGYYTHGVKGVAETTGHPLDSMGVAKPPLAALATPNFFVSFIYLFLKQKI
jgi:hypothetical protein